MRACSQCGKQNEPEARFCSQCGTPLAAAEPAREVRKTVTVLFCDVAGSTALEERTGGMAEAFALVVRGRYRARQRDLAAGRADIDAGRALIRDLGAMNYVAGSGQEQAQCELEAGEWARAEAVLRETCELFEQMGIVAPSAVVMLAQALVEQGRLDEAEACVRIMEENAAADDISEQFAWRSTRARILARRGDGAPAESLAREAVALAEQTDHLEGHAYALLALAEVLAGGGRAEEARSAIEEAVAVYKRKESVVGVERARVRVLELEQAQPERAR